MSDCPSCYSYTCARDALATAQRALLASSVEVYKAAAAEIFDLYRESGISDLALLAGVMERRAERLGQQTRDVVRAAKAKRIA